MMRLKRGGEFTSTTGGRHSAYPTGIGITTPGHNPVAALCFWGRALALPS